MSKPNSSNYVVQRIFVKPEDQKLTIYNVSFFGFTSYAMNDNKVKVRTVCKQNTAVAVMDLFSNIRTFWHPI